MTIIQERVGYGDARLFTMRDLNHDTAGVIQAINDSGEPAVITKHGRFVALITPLAGRNFEGRLVGELLRQGQERDLVADTSEDDPGLTTAELAEELGVHGD